MTASHKRANYTRREIDRDYPHQVGLPDDMCCMENYAILENFCRQMGASHRTAAVTAIWECGTQELFRLYCFSERKHADRFAAHFEGVLFNPAKDRQKGGNAWKRSSKWQRVLSSGPLRLPRFFIDHP